MALWVDKYRPTELIGKQGVDYHSEQAVHLRSLINGNNMPHLLFCGPSGAGKKTRIKCLLRELYGAGVNRTQLIMKQFTTQSNRKLEIQTVSSNYHIELTPADVGLYDRVVVQDIVKEMAQTAQIDASSQKSFKVVVLCEADSLTKDAQHALRRTMEKYAANCRIVLCCESLSRIIEPLQSRCMLVHVPAPDDDTISRIVSNVCRMERCDLPSNILQQIVNKCDGNLRRALLIAEATRMQYDSGSIPDDAKIPIPEWETYLQETASMILQKQTSEMILKVRERIYEILSRCIPPNIIFNKLVEYLIPKCNESIVPEVIEAAVEYEHRMVLGQKAIFHIEAFIIAFMDIYLNHASTKKK